MIKTVQYFLFVLFTGLLLCANNVSAQTGITIDASQQMTTFEFTSSDGNIDNSYSPIYTGAYHFGYSYFLDNGIYFNAGIGMRNAGATMAIDATNLRWDFKYGQGKLGGGYMYELGRINPYLGIAGYYARLLTANQRINDPKRENINYDLLESGSILENDYGLLITPGVRLSASEYISVYTEFSYLMGLQNLQPGDTGQEAINAGYAITLGVSFNLINKDE
ncbi:MAG: hypothetical protein V5A59_09070 [Bacteroidales bacterium]